MGQARFDTPSLFCHFFCLPRLPNANANARLPIPSQKPPRPELPTPRRFPARLPSHRLFGVPHWGTKPLLWGDSARGKKGHAAQPGANQQGPRGKISMDLDLTCKTCRILLATRQRWCCSAGSRRLAPPVGVDQLVTAAFCALEAMLVSARDAARATRTPATPLSCRRPR